MIPTVRRMRVLPTKAPLVNTITVFVISPLFMGVREREEKRERERERERERDEHNDVLCRCIHVYVPLHVYLFDYL